MGRQMVSSRSVGGKQDDSWGLLLWNSTYRSTGRLAVRHQPTRNFGQSPCGTSVGINAELAGERRGSDEVFMPCPEEFRCAGIKDSAEKCEPSQVAARLTPSPASPLKTRYTCCQLVCFPSCSHSLAGRATTFFNGLLHQMQPFRFERRQSVCQRLKESACWIGRSVQI